CWPHLGRVASKSKAAWPCLAVPLGVCGVVLANWHTVSGRGTLSPPGLFCPPHDGPFQRACGSGGFVLLPRDPPMLGGIGRCHENLGGRLPAFAGQSGIRERGRPVGQAGWRTCWLHRGLGWREDRAGAEVLLIGHHVMDSEKSGHRTEPAGRDTSG